MEQERVDVITFIAGCFSIAWSKALNGRLWGASDQDVRTGQAHDSSSLGQSPGGVKEAIQIIPTSSSRSERTPRQLLALDAPVKKSIDD